MKERIDTVFFSVMRSSAKLRVSGTEKHMKVRHFGGRRGHSPLMVSVYVPLCRLMTGI